MKPYPFEELKNLTVPLFITIELKLKKYTCDEESQAFEKTNRGTANYFNKNTSAKNGYCSDFRKCETPSNHFYSVVTSADITAQR
jgi:hypothetical protein